METGSVGNARTSEKLEDFTAVVENKSEDEKPAICGMTTVFSNELIWKTLGRCLNVSDLKCCRLVSRKFNQMVMHETKFKERVVLKIKKKKLTPEEFGKTEESWKKISLNFPVENAMNSSNFDWLYPILAESEFLSLRLHGKVTTSAATDFHPLLGRLLSSCPKLKSLALEPEFIQLGSGRISEGTETVLEKLEQLEILEPDYRIRKPLPCCEYTMEPVRKIVPDFCGKLKNLKVYKSYFTEFRMNSASFVSIGCRGAWMEAVFLFSLCESIVKNNCQHLQSYPFYDISSLSIDEVVFSSDVNHDTPALTALEVDSFNLQMPIGISDFISCLKSRPPLEQLDISCPFYDPMDNTILSDIISSVAHHRVSLKKLKLRITTLENLTDWIFLRDSTLKALHLEDCRTAVGEKEWIRQVMTNVPKSIEKLYLKGALPKPGQQKQKSLMEPLKIEYFARLDPQLVTQLSIFNAGGLVDNSVVEFICKNFKMLRKLNLSNAQTDDAGFSKIAGLKGLQFLTLKLCGISDQTLKLIRYVELRYLDIAGNPETSLTGIKMTMKKCPSLETLIVPLWGPKFTTDDGQKICPRLKFLIPSLEGLQETWKEAAV